MSFNISKYYFRKNSNPNLISNLTLVKNFLYNEKLTQIFLAISILIQLISGIYYIISDLLRFGEPTTEKPKFNKLMTFVINFLIFTMLVRYRIAEPSGFFTFFVYFSFFLQLFLVILQAAAMFQTYNKEDVINKSRFSISLFILISISFSLLTSDSLEGFYLVSAPLPLYYLIYDCYSENEANFSKVYVLIYSPVQVLSLNLLISLSEPYSIYPREEAIAYITNRLVLFSVLILILQKCLHPKLCYKWSYEKSLKKFIPIRKRLGDLDVNREENYKCEICWEEFIGANSIVVETYCHHHFHENCLVRWFEEKMSCPVCNLECKNFEDDVLDVTETEMGINL